MKKQMNKVIKISAAFLLCAISLCGCKQEEQMNNYMENVTANQISVNPECVTQNAGKVADFSKIGNCDGNGLYISRATHKTKIVVDELGTRAQAETDIAAAAASEALEYREVYLNRPFVYLIMDCENGIPLFIGTVREI